MTTQMQKLLDRVDGGMPLVPHSSLVSSHNRHKSPVGTRAGGKSAAKRELEERQRAVVRIGRVPRAIEALVLAEPEELLPEELLPEELFGELRAENQALLAAGI